MLSLEIRNYPKSEIVDIAVFVYGLCGFTSVSKLRPYQVNSQGCSLEGQELHTYLEDIARRREDMNFIFEW